ncbi:MAG: 2-oxoglutarate oxidoreductase [Deltaproteobacteria bacterium]|nr:MAG: 2-oxoglutarate oxidoreductase [Deltaproteobacteria bacterium]
MYGLKLDWDPEPETKCFVLQDYQGLEPRWCPGCGDLAVLAALQRLVRDEQIPPEKIAVISGIGCSSRFPHYMKTYGFHGLHGRPLPIASGVRSRRPDLDVFVITGDGDCCAIGTSHWIHAIRYNMNMTVLMLDNNIYGLTKMQSSPTTRLGKKSNTHPRGTILGPLDPISVTLSITNASFVAQTVDWNPPHVLATIRAAHEHQGLSFVRIMQRCPHYTPEIWTEYQQDPSCIFLLDHPDGIPVDAGVARLFENKVDHDPSDLPAARDLAALDEVIPIGLLYRNPDAQRYDLAMHEGLDMPLDDRITAAQAEVDRFLI